MEEIWKTYQEHSLSKCGRKLISKIEVSNKGNLKINDKLIDLSYQNNYVSSYYRVCGKYVHRMIAELFIPNPENKTHVDHIDGNTHNNNINNLHWVSHKENLNMPLAKQHMQEHASCHMKGKHLSNDVKQFLKNYWNGGKHMNNGIIGKYVPKDKINEYLKLGYTFGMLKTR